MRRTGRIGDPGTACLPGESSAGAGGVIAGIVLAMLLIAAVLAGLLYAAGAFHDDAPASFNLVRSGSIGLGPGHSHRPA